MAGLAYGAQHFRALSAVSVVALLGVFVPVVLWGSRRNNGEVTLRLLLAAKTAHAAFTFAASAAVLLLGRRGDSRGARARGEDRAAESAVGARPADASPPCGLTAGAMLAQPLVVGEHGSITN